MKTLYLRDATFLDWRTLEIRRSDFAVTVGPGGSVRGATDIPADAEVLDCAGKIVTKSFAIGHHHAYSALARGMPPPTHPPATFVEILERIWWHLDAQLDAAMVRASGLVTAVEAARCGSTFVIDHHASPNATADSLHILADAFDEVDVGHLLCYELSDRDGAERSEAALEETNAYLKHHQGLVGLHASFTVSDALLERASDLADTHGTGVHIHVAEAESDEEHSRTHHGMSVISRLDRAGALTCPQTILAHCLHLDDTEREQVRASQAWVVQNAESNQNNNVGRFDPRGLGDRVFLGTDGMHSDMLAACRATYLDGQAVGGLSPGDAYARLRRVHDYLRANGFAGDSQNDLVVFDYPSPTPITAENWAGHLVYGLGSRHVHSVIREGRVLLDAGRLTTVDEDAVLADARVQAQRLWKRL